MAEAFSYGFVPPIYPTFHRLGRVYTNVEGRFVDNEFLALYQQITNVHGHMVFEPELTRRLAPNVLMEAVTTALALAREMIETNQGEVTTIILQDWSRREANADYMILNTYWIKSRIQELYANIHNATALQISQLSMDVLQGRLDFANTTRNRFQGDRNRADIGIQSATNEIDHCTVTIQANQILINGLTANMPNGGISVFPNLWNLMHPPPGNPPLP